MVVGLDTMVTPGVEVTIEDSASNRNYLIAVLSVYIPLEACKSMETLYQLQ